MKKTLSKVLTVTLALAMIFCGVYAMPATASAAKAKTVKVTQVKATPTSIKLSTGETKDITTAIKPTTATNKEVSYTSSNKKVATVSKEGTVTAIGAGKATITVKATDTSKKYSKVTVTVYQDATITNADVKDGVATLAAGTYGNVIVSKTVDNAKVVVNKAVVKGTLSLESGAAYTVEATQSNIKNLKVVASAALTAQAETEDSLFPSFVAAKGAIITNVTIKAPVSIERTIGRIASISIEPAAKAELPVEIKGFIGDLVVSKADGSSVTIAVSDSKIKSASVEGGAEDQSVKLTSAAEDTSIIQAVQVAGGVSLSVDVPAKTVEISKEAENAAISIDKPVTTVTNAGASTALIVNSVVTTVTTTGAKASVEVTKVGTVATATIVGADTQLSGDGKVTDAKVEGEGAKISVPTTNVTVKDGVNYTGTTPTPAPAAPIIPVPAVTTTTANYTLEHFPVNVVVKFANNKTFTMNVSRDLDILDVLTQKTYTDNNSGITATVTSSTNNNYVVTLSGTVTGTYTVHFDPIINKHAISVTYTSESAAIAEFLPTYK